MANLNPIEKNPPSKLQKHFQDPNNIRSAQLIGDESLCIICLRQNEEICPADAPFLRCSFIPTSSKISPTL